MCPLASQQTFSRKRKPPGSKQPSRRYDRMNRENPSAGKLLHLAAGQK